MTQGGQKHVLGFIRYHSLVTRSLLAPQQLFSLSHRIAILGPVAINLGYPYHFAASVSHRRYRQRYGHQAPVISAARGLESRDHFPGSHPRKQVGHLGLASLWD